MERLHKRSRIGLLLSILLALSACAAQPGPAGSAAQLQWLTNQRPDGVYVTAGGLLTWFDYTGQSAAYLCAQPNCAHDTDACTARPPLGPGGQGTSIRGCYAAGERLILAVSDGAVSSIWTAGADGGDRRLLVDWTADEVWPRLTDGSSLYYTCAVPGDTAAPGRTMLCRVPLDGGSAEELLELRDPGDGASWEELLGACGRGVVTLYSTPDGGALTPPRRTEEMTDAEYDAARQAYGSALVQQTITRQVLVRELDGSGERVLARWQSAAGDMGWLSAWRDGTLWQLKTDGTAVRTVAADGQMTETAVQWPEELAGCWMSGAPEGVLDGRLLVQVTAPQDGSSHRVAVNPADGSAEVIRLYQLTDLHGDPRYGAQYAMEPMKLYGAGSGQVLLACAMRDTSRPAMAEDGSLYETWDRETQYGLLSTADFFASRQNWTQVDAGCQIDFGWAWQPE